MNVNALRASCYKQEAFRDCFNFSRVFKKNTGQQEFIERTLMPFFAKIIDGENVLIFSSGLTNSGKTHTIYGKNFFLFTSYLGGRDAIYFDYNFLLKFLYYHVALIKKTKIG